MQRSLLLLRLLGFGALLGLSLPLGAEQTSTARPSMSHAFRRDVNGWVYIHIEGPPRQLGFQNGYLVATNFAGFNRVLQAYLPKTTGKDWLWYRGVAQSLFWPKLDRQYKEEIQGIAEGLRARGLHFDYLDVTAQNAWIEISDYYLPWLESQLPADQRFPRSRAPEACSAIIATGDQTAEGKIVICHTAWDDYITGQRMNMIVDMVPQDGSRILMDSMPGLIDSITDFYVTSFGLVVTETTIGDFFGYKVNALPEFMRARKAVQYAHNLDQFVGIVSGGDSGGYANTWLIGDVKSNEIGRLELGLKNKTFYRSKTGAYPSCNFIDDPKMIREECTANLWTFSNTCSDRMARWLFLMNRDMGTMDAEKAKGYMADHFDQPLGIEQPGGRCLDGHMELTSIPELPGAAAPRPFGANQSKVCTAEMAKRMSFWGRMGHACGITFDIVPFAAQYPTYAWEIPYFRNVESHPWTVFQSRR